MTDRHPHRPARQGRDPGPGAALHPQVPWQDHGHQVRRQRHDRPRAAGRLRRGRGAAQAGGHEPGGGARRRPADRDGAQPPGQEGRVHPGHARDRRRDHGSRRMGAGRRGAAGHRGPDQPGRRQGRGPDRARRRPDPRAEAQDGRQQGPEQGARRRPGRRHRRDRPERGARRCRTTTSSPSSARSASARRTRATTSTPTWWPASWPPCCRPRSWCC